MHPTHLSVANCPSRGSPCIRDRAQGEWILALMRWTRGRVISKGECWEGGGVLEPWRVAIPGGESALGRGKEDVSQRS